MINNYPIVNIYEKKALKSKLSSQLIYGEKFKILSKKNGWLKIKTSYDKYTGFIKKRKFIKNMKVTHKISSLFANIYSKPKNKFILNFKLPFCSLISVTEKTKNFYKFQNYWIKKKDVLPVNYKRQTFKKIKIFKNIPYNWGGRTYKGIDC